VAKNGSLHGNQIWLAQKRNRPAASLHGIGTDRVTIRGDESRLSLTALEEVRETSENSCAVLRRCRPALRDQMLRTITIVPSAPMGGPTVILLSNDQ